MFRSFFKRNVLSRDPWPMPHVSGVEPHVLFVITPPYSGSTALAELLQTSQYITSLQERAEGQWLIPELSARDRWVASKEVNFESVRRVWLAKFDELKKDEPQLSVLVEKSPPNMVRLEPLLGLFKSVSLLANNRNPYANIASLAKRVVRRERSAPNRSDLIEGLATEWVKRSALIRDLVSNHSINLVTYEQFCQNPKILIEKLDLDSRVIASIEFDKQLSIKGNKPTELVNFNAVQIDSLSDQDIKIISNKLLGNEELLEFFGYEIIYN